MIDNKFSTKYDYSQALYGLICFVTLLTINFNLKTLIFAFVILAFGIYKGFGRRIIFYKEDVIIHHLGSKIKINLFNLREVSYTTNLYGKSILSVVTSDKKYKGYIDYEQWQRLKIWLTRFIHTLVYFDEKSLNIFTLDFCGNI